MWCENELNPVEIRNMKANVLFVSNVELQWLDFLLRKVTAAWCECVRVWVDSVIDSKCQQHCFFWTVFVQFYMIKSESCSWKCFKFNINRKFSSKLFRCFIKRTSFKQKSFEQNRNQMQRQCERVIRHFCVCSSIDCSFT